MKKEELRECQFIDEALKFYTYEDFYRDKKTIKAMYRTLDNKIFYKWFVYANINISLVQKDAIWELLNEPLFLIKNSENCVDKKKNL